MCLRKNNQLRLRHEFCLEVNNSSTPTSSFLQAELWSSMADSLVLGEGQSTAAIAGFLREKGFDDGNIEKLLKKCRRLEGLAREKAMENWEYLKSIGIHERKLRGVVCKCPKLLAISVDEKLLPVVQCLSALGTKPEDVAAAVVKFPPILSLSVEEKLCPLLAFLQTVGIPEDRAGKLVLLNPRLVSYSIQEKLSEMVTFLAGLGFGGDSGKVGKILIKNPYIMGYSVERRLRPTADFLRSIGLKEPDLRKLLASFPQVLCRDAEKTLRPNLDFLRRSGFSDREIAMIVAGYPPVLIKSIENSLKPRIRFLVDAMGRELREVAEYPEFFRHGLKKSLEARHRQLEKRGVRCSLSEMLDCNHTKFAAKFCAV